MTIDDEFFSHMHLLQTNDPYEGSSLCSTLFETGEDLERYADWMKFVQQTAYELGIKESDLLEFGLDVWDHQDLYRLYKNRKGLPKFFEKLAGYEKKIKYNHRLEDTDVVDLFKEGTELD